MKLHYSPTSPFVRKVLVCAHERGLAGEIELAPPATLFDGTLARDNPLEKVPTLVPDDGPPLYDSLVIACHLDGLGSGPRLLPEAVGARMTRRRLRKLRYPKETVDDAAELVFLHMRTHTFKMGWTDSAVRRYVRDAGHLLPKLNQLARCDVTTRSDRRARRIQRHIDELEERIVHLRAKEELDSLRAPIDGHRVMAYLGIDPGPAVGVVMKLLLEKRIEDGPYGPSEAYALVRRWALSEGLEDPGPPPPADQNA